MKKIILFILLSLVLVSCKKEYSFPEGWDTSEWYYFQDVTETWTLPEIEWAKTFEILKKEDCWVSEKFDITENKLVTVSYNCPAMIEWNYFFRVMMEDGKYRYYELIENSDGDEWILSNNTF